MTDPAALWNAWTAAELAYSDEVAKYFSREGEAPESIDDVGMAKLADLRTRLTVAQTSYAATRQIAEAKTQDD
jgi:hypothetical protein